MEELDIEAEFRQYAELQQALESGDVITITAALAGAKNASSLIKEAMDLASTVKNADLVRSLSKLNLEMANVENALATAQREATALEDENIALKKQLKEAQSPSVKIIRKSGLSYVEGDEETPICASCYGATGKVIPLNFSPLPPQLRAGNSQERYKCSNCDAIVYQQN